MTPRPYDPDFYSVYFPLADTVPDESVRTLLTEGFEGIWATSGDGEDTGVLYHGPETGHQTERYGLDVAIDCFLSDATGSITVFADDIDFSLSRVSAIDHAGPDRIGGFRICLERVHFNRALREEDYDVVPPLVETGSFLLEHLPAPFAFSRIPNDLEYETEVTQEHVTQPRLPDVYWLTLLSDRICTDIGRARLDTTPAWKAEPIEGGGFGWVVTNHPYDYRREDKQRIRDHLSFGD